MQEWKYFALFKKINSFFLNFSNNIALLNCKIRSANKNLLSSLNCFKIMFLSFLFCYSKIMFLCVILLTFFVNLLFEIVMGSGVSLFITKILGYILRNDIKLRNCVAVEMYKEQLQLSRKVAIISVYRPPHTGIKDFNMEF